jgi:hypothetical protein
MLLRKHLFSRNIVSGSWRMNRWLVGKLGRRRGRVGVASRVAGMVDGGVDRAHVDPVLDLAGCLSGGNVQLRVGDVVRKLEAVVQD